MVDRHSLANEWLRDAAADLIMAERALGPGELLWSMAAFHFQQAVEEPLKAFLTYHGRVFEKTHDLARLCSACGEVHPDIVALIDQVDRLTDYAVDARYPGVEKPVPTEIDEVQRRLTEFVDDLRRKGRFEARGSHRIVTQSDDGLSVDLAVTIDPGPEVVVRYEGDPLPKERIDELVPILRQQVADAQ